MRFLENGFEMVKGFIQEHWLNIILKDIEAADFSTDVSGVRNINKKLKSVADYLGSSEFITRANNFLPKNANLVRAILFNKSPESNWFVTWHQDKTVSVSAKFDQPGWGVWSIKDHTLHVQPPLAVLESMVAIRIHLDPAFKDNGCLKVIPNSHKLGILSPEKISTITASEKPYYCEADQCSALIMRPHLLHSSGKSSNPTNRRVLHLEFSDWQLPDGIYWGG